MAPPCNPAIVRLIASANANIPLAVERYDAILSAQAEGRMTRDEALAAAEVVAYVAASTFAQDRMWALAGVLVARRQALLGAGDYGRAEAYRDQAARVLARLSEGGDGRATAAFVDLCPDGWAETDATLDAAQRMDANYLGIAACQPDAMATVLDNMLVGAENGIPPRDALVGAEEVARLGVAFGDLAMGARLAGVLALRAMYEWHEGNTDRGNAAMADGFGMALALISAGDKSMIDALRETVGMIPAPMFAAVCAAHPEALAFCELAGAA